MQPSEKRVALVTGANRGIGFEIARQLARKGLTVILGSRDEQKGMNAHNQLTAEGLDVHFTYLDVADTTSIMAAVGRINDSFKRLDVLVNNAGIMIDPETTVLELPMTLLQNTLETQRLWATPVESGLCTDYEKAPIWTYYQHFQHVRIID